MSELTVGFATPAEVITFIRDCVALNDPDLLYRACATPPNSFWRDRLFQDLIDIEQSERLHVVFLDARNVSNFPEEAVHFTLGGCDPRTRHLHIDLEKGAEGWQIEQIWKCR